MSLKQYLEAAYRETRLTSEADLGPIRHLNSILRKDQDNLLLVYGGSFNPPHRGHLEVLLSGLHPKVAAIGIVILPSEDFHLRNKVANSHPDFFLYQKRRADIWDAIPLIPREKVWVWTSTWYPFKPCFEALVRLAAADGYEIALSNMIGPDNLNLRTPLNNPPYPFPRILVTNKARHVESHFLPDGKPVVWNGFSKWSQCGSGHRQDKNQSQEDTLLWTCTGLGDNNAGTRGYYLQYAESISADINSTSLRKDFVQAHLLNEATLNQKSTDALLELLAPILL